MADDLQSMLNTIGQKFDMSFDEGDHQPDKVLLTDHQRSINPQNRMEGTSCIQTQQNPTQYQTSESIKHLPYPNPQQKQEEIIQVQQPKTQIQVPFLPLADKQYGQPEEGDLFEDKPVLLQGQTGAQFSCEQQEMEYYRSLSEKFQDALNKAHSRKSISTCGRGEFMERQEHYLRRKQTTLTQLLQEKERREKGQIRVKPLINSHSQQILQHHTPIEHRYPAVIAQRKRKVQAWQAEKKRAEEQAKLAEQLLMQKWRQEAKERVGEIRTIDEYFQSQQRWNERRYKAIEQSGKKQDQSLRAEASFKPKINPRSDNMMKKKLERVPVYEKQPQIKKLPNDPHCTFKPNLAKTLKRI